jgi:hypothetical protein
LCKLGLCKEQLEICSGKGPSTAQVYSEGEPMDVHVHVYGGNLHRKQTIALVGGDHYMYDFNK